MHKPKNNEQLRRIFGLAKRRDLRRDQLATYADEVSYGRVERLSLLSFDEANRLITRLGGDPVPAYARRTINHHRQLAGVPQIAGQRQLRYMRDLTAKRGITEDGLERLCRRMLKGSPRPRTTAETNKIIEAIKAMNHRDSQKATPAAAAGSARGGSFGRAA